MLTQEGRTAELLWVKAHAGTPGNEKADRLAGKAERAKPSSTSLAYLKLRVSEKFRHAKDAWHADPRNHGV